MHCGSMHSCFISKTRSCVWGGFIVWNDAHLGLCYPGPGPNRLTTPANPTSPAPSNLDQTVLQGRATAGDAAWVSATSARLADAYVAAQGELLGRLLPEGVRGEGGGGGGAVSAPCRV